jgi:hypothetical protein
LATNEPESTPKPVSGTLACPRRPHWPPEGLQELLLIVRRTKNRAIERLSLARDCVICNPDPRTGNLMRIGSLKPALVRRSVTRCSYAVNKISPFITEKCWLVARNAILVTGRSSTCPAGEDTERRNASTALSLLTSVLGGPPEAIACAGSSGWIRVFPLNRPGVCGIGVDVAAQFSGQIRDGGEDAACDHIALDSSEPEFDLVEPGRVGEGEMELNPGILFQELTHQGGFVSRQIVQDDVNLLAPGANRNDLLEESQKLSARGGLFDFRIRALKKLWLATDR